MGRNEDIKDLPCSINHTWRIVEMMCAYPDRYGDEITEALKIAATRDTTDLKRAYTLKIQAI